MVLAIAIVSCWQMRIVSQCSIYPAVSSIRRIHPSLSSLHPAWQMRAYAGIAGAVRDDGGESDFSDGSTSDCSTDWDID